jgi:hypothetical protein
MIGWLASRFIAEKHLALGQVHFAAAELPREEIGSCCVKPFRFLFNKCPCGVVAMAMEVEPVTWWEQNHGPIRECVAGHTDFDERWF